MEGKFKIEIKKKLSLKGVKHNKNEKFFLDAIASREPGLLVSLSSLLKFLVNLKVSISFETIETIDTNKDHETNRDLLTNKDLENKKGIFKPCLLMSERNIITFYQFRRSVKDY